MLLWERSGQISGTVTGPNGSTPLPNIDVAAYSEQGDWLDATMTDENGRYLLSGFTSGNYHLFFNSIDDSYLDEYYDDAPSLYEAALVGVNVGEVTTNINASLDRAGYITGRVTQTDGSSPLTSIAVNVFRWSDGYWSWHNSALTDIDGYYQVMGLDTYTYRVSFSDWNGYYLPEFYDDQPDIDSATDIFVTAGQVTADINASLQLGGHITGEVTKVDGTTPLPNISVAVYQQHGDDWWAWIGSARTDYAGGYVLPGLATGTYRVRFSDDTRNYLGEYYDDATRLDEATDVFVTAETVTSGINASLAKSGRISGITRGGVDGNTPLSDVNISAYQYNGEWWEWMGDAVSQEDGTYTVVGLRTGMYLLGFTDWSGEHLLEYYDDKPDLLYADEVAVVTGIETVGINASLTMAGRITGTVTGPNGNRLPYIGVTVYKRESWGLAYTNGGATDWKGRYDVGGLETGQYVVQFSDWYGNYLGEYYNDVLSADAATNIAVTVGDITANINASLARSGHIKGNIMAADASALSYTNLTAHRFIDGGWQPIGYGYADENGDYTIIGLDTGTYRLSIDAMYSHHLPFMYYDGAHTIDEATDISVTRSLTTTLDIEMPPFTQTYLPMIKSD